jgi:hypothetical protein
LAEPFLCFHRQEHRELPRVRPAAPALMAKTSSTAWDARCRRWVGERSMPAMGAPETIYTNNHRHRKRTAKHAGHQKKKHRWAMAHQGVFVRRET